MFTCWHKHSHDWAEGSKKLFQLGKLKCLFETLNIVCTASATDMIWIYVELSLWTPCSSYKYTVLVNWPTQNVDTLCVILEGRELSSEDLQSLQDLPILQILQVLLLQQQELHPLLKKTINSSSWLTKNIWNNLKQSLKMWVSKYEYQQYVLWNIIYGNSVFKLINIHYTVGCKSIQPS